MRFSSQGCIISAPRVLIELKLKKLKEIPGSLLATQMLRPFEIWLALWAHDSMLKVFDQGPFFHTNF